MSTICFFDFSKNLSIPGIRSVKIGKKGAFFDSKIGGSGSSKPNLMYKHILPHNFLFEQLFDYI